MKRIMMAAVVAMSVALVGCGERVEVPAAHIAKIMTKDGYKDGVITTSKFRLDPCLAYCDKLVLLDVSDNSASEKMELFMPKSKLNMTFDLRVTMMVKPSSYEELFNKVPPTQANGIDFISIKRAYDTYAQQVIRSESREFLSQYSIDEIASSREAVNSQLAERLSKAISERTPFQVKYVGLADIKYPDIIVKAQENAAERREQIQQEEAQLEISKVQLERQLQEQQLQRKVDVEKALAESEVNKILASSITPAYLQYRSLNVLDKMAESQNKVFVPAAMLDSMASQVMLGRQ